jgi:transketolase
LRIGKCDIGAVHKGPIKYDWGALIEMRPGDGGLGFIATGSMVAAALKEALRWEGSSVWSAPSLKPLDAEQVIAICHNHRAIITLEEHSIYGGLGAAITEISSTYRPCWVERIGVQDRFAQYAGSYEYLRSEHGLDTSGISRQVDEFIERIGESGLRLSKSSRTEVLVPETK